MNETTVAVLEALDSDAPIERKRVLQWMRDPDLDTRALVYRLTREAWSRITPDLTMNEQCSFMAAYLLDCIATNRQDDEDVHSGFEAAWELAAWLKHLRTISGTETVIEGVVRDLERLYRRSDRITRNRIETGAVEHIFEDAPLRRYFAHWRSDPELEAAYENCLAWGEGHSGRR